MPRPAPSRTELVLDAVTEIAHQPTAIADVLGLAIRDARASAGRAFAAAGGVLATLSSLQSATARPKSSPLQVRTGERRRFASVRADLADYRQIRSDQDVDVNDVVLAVVTGALRSWLLLRGEAVQHTSTLRAMVPLSIDDPNQIVPIFIDLPIGEPNPLVRLSQIAFATRANAQSAKAVGAKALAAIGGFAPPTLHALAARVAGGLSNRLFQVAITNAPGPQHPLYAAGSRLSEIYPIVPVASGQAVAIGVTSYDGGVYFGINADYDALPDLSQLADGLELALAELLAANAQSGAALARRTRLSPVKTPVKTPVRTSGKATAKTVGKTTAKTTAKSVDGRNRRTAAE
jgi:WS/DGAT/MGAT family acyltransferase